MIFDLLCNCVCSKQTHKNWIPNELIESAKYCENRIYLRNANNIAHFIFTTTLSEINWIESESSSPFFDSLFAPIFHNFHSFYWHLTNFCNINGMLMQAKVQVTHYHNWNYTFVSVDIANLWVSSSEHWTLFSLFIKSRVPMKIWWDAMPSASIHQIG